MRALVHEGAQMANGIQDPATMTQAQMQQVAQKDEDLTAVVIGAGVAGLTVAHELAERRFKVWVIEPTWDVNRFGQTSIAIGGMARTQYVAARENRPGYSLTGTVRVIP